jgi:general secretion pathway protein G
MNDGFYDPPREIPGRNEERGFTLVEMMVVIVIIGLLATVVIINVMPATDRAAQTRVKADLDTLGQALDMYRLENMRYPTAQEGLAALQPNYVRRLPNDPWNSPYVYVTPGPNGAPYRIASLGADKKEGGSGEDADVTN